MTQSVAEGLAERVCALDQVPESVQSQCENLLLDVAGLCVAARNSDYISSLKKSLDAGGACTALGHAERYSPEDAALLNGTAAHGEDFDDTSPPASASASTATARCSASPPAWKRCVG